MTKSTIATYLMTGMLFAHGTEISAAPNHSLPPELPNTLKSIAPFSAKQRDMITIMKSRSSKVAPTNKSDTSMKYESVIGGGYGGNEQTGLLVYDGLPHHPAALTIQRDDKNKLCFMENQEAGIYHASFWGFLKPASYECLSANKYHNGVYWNENLDRQNGGYSTDNDALYASMMINRMYKEWFGISVTQNTTDSPLSTKIVTHRPGLNNAYLDPNDIIVLGDGDESHYPYTTPGPVSFVMAYLFTRQHSDLDYSNGYEQSAAISIAFSSMADQAIKYYINGDNDWQIGSEVSKTDQPLYYIEQPSKDCASGSTPGVDCSIEHLSQYKKGTPSHFSSGIYRRAFYLLATTPDWDVKKTFSVMVQANRFYWTPKQDFSQGVCGLIKAARDYHYDESAVIEAFNQVGVSSKNC